jgi:hypothetical protein
MGYDMVLVRGDRASVTVPQRWGTPGRSGAAFRVNIAGMAWLRDVMNDLGMLDWDRPAHHVSVSYERIRSLPADDPVVVAFYAAEQETGRGPLIPAFKFLSNDWWLVTPTEIRSALDVYQHHGDAPVRSALEANEEEPAEEPRLPDLHVGGLRARASAPDSSGLPGEIRATLELAKPAASGGARSITDQSL